MNYDFNRNLKGKLFKYPGHTYNKMIFILQVIKSKKYEIYFIHQCKIIKVIKNINNQNINNSFNFDSLSSFAKLLIPIENVDNNIIDILYG